TKRGTRARNQKHPFQPRTTLHQRDPCARDRRSAESQLWSSRNADGDGTGCVSDFYAFLAPQPQEPALVWPRSVCALGWSWIDVAVQPAVSDRLRSAAGGNQAFPPIWQQN